MDQQADELQESLSDSADTSNLHLEPELARLVAARHAGTAEKLRAEAEQHEQWTSTQDDFMQRVSYQQERMMGRIVTLRQVMTRQQQQIDQLVTGLDAFVKDPNDHTATQKVVRSGTDFENQDGKELTARLNKLRWPHLKSCMNVESPEVLVKGEANVPLTRHSRVSLGKVQRSRLHVMLWKDQTETLLGRLITNPRFESLCAVVICVNAVFIGFRCEYEVTQRSASAAQTNDFIQAMEIFFFCFYALELVLKLQVYRLNFFTNNDMLWNLFDFALVLNAAYDLIQEAVMSNQGQGGTVWLRVLRLLKMLKMLRMVRVMRFFRELRLMLKSITGSAKVLFWSSVLLFLVMYTFGLCFLQATTLYLSEIPPESLEDSQTASDAQEYWGSLGSSIVSLYMVVTGGADWAPIAEPLWEVGETYYIIFLFYIALLVLAILNILTGIFAEAAMEVRRLDQDNVVHEEMQRERSCINDIKRLFKELDTDESGAIMWEEFKVHLEKAEVRAFLGTLELNAAGAVELFRLLADEENKVTCEDFIEGCTKYRGAAKSIDLMELAHDSKQFAQQLAVFMPFFEESCESVFAALGKDDGITYIEPLASRLRAARCPLAALRRHSTITAGLAVKDDLRL